MTTQCCDGIDPGEEMNYTNQIAGPGNLVTQATAVPLSPVVTLVLAVLLGGGVVTRRNRQQQDGRSVG